MAKYQPTEQEVEEALEVLEYEWKKWGRVDEFKTERVKIAETLRSEVIPLIKTYFWWLVEEYGFTHLGDYSHFQNDKMWVEIALGHVTPRIALCRVGDNPFDYAAGIGEVIKFFDPSCDQFTDKGGYTRDTTHYTLEENVAWIADPFRRYADRIIYEFDRWWIPVKLAFYKRLKREAKEEGWLDTFPKAYRYLYEYLKENGVPKSELEDP